MTEITKYIADDGKEFDDEDECCRYEFECKTKVTQGLKLWRTTPTSYERVNCDEYGLHIADLCIIEDDAALALIKALGDEYKYDVPEELGMWYWNEDFGCGWTRWEDYEGVFNAFQFMKQQSNIVQF